MKNKLSCIALFPLVALLFARNVFPQSTNALSSTNAPGQGQRRGGNANNNDAFYKLGLIPKPVTVRDAVWTPNS